MKHDENAELAWRNLVVAWHAERDTDCGCDDDTPDNKFCAPSATYADEQFAHLPDPALEGPPDKWDHDIWVAAWGYNATLVVADRDFRLPAPPREMMWLLTRMLVRGVKVIDIALMKLGKNNVTTLAHGRVVPEPTTVAAKARKMLQELPS